VDGDHDGYARGICHAVTGGESLRRYESRS
jgi:hypothetical protein